MRTYIGQCHCGKVQFEVKSEFDDPFTCNCSFCIRRSTTLHTIPTKQFRMVTGEEEMVKYGAREFSKHFFCKTCGIHCFSRIGRKKVKYVNINIGCVVGLDLSDLRPRLFDGAGSL